MNMTIPTFPIDADTILRWELALIFVSCYVIFLLYAALGIRFDNIKKSYPQKILFLAFIFTAVKILFCATFYRWIEAGSFLNENMMNMVLNMLWSPLMPLAVVWLYLAHSAKSCNDCSMLVPVQNVRTLPRPVRVFAYVMSGICTTFLTYTFGYLCARNATAVIAIFTLIGLLGASLELIYFKARDNIVQMASPTWCWFCGTWLGAVIISLF